MDIVELTRTTATNMHELLNQLANHIATLEAENAELKAQIEASKNATK